MDQSPVINVKHVNLFVGYVFKQENCTICRGNLSAPPASEYNSDQTTNSIKSSIDCSVLLGKCDHMYHKKCIQSLKKNNYVSCPQCNVVWENSETLTCHVSCN